MKGKSNCKWCQLGECWTHQGASVKGGKGGKGGQQLGALAGSLLGGKGVGDDTAWSLIQLGALLGKGAGKSWGGGKSWGKGSSWSTFPVKQLQLGDAATKEEVEAFLAEHPQVDDDARTLSRSYTRSCRERLSIEVE